MASAVTVKRHTTVTLVGSSASGLFYNKWCITLDGTIGYVSFFALHPFFKVASSTPSPDLSKDAL